MSSAAVLLDALREMVELRDCTMRAEIHPRGELNIVRHARALVAAGLEQPTPGPWSAIANPHLPGQSFVVSGPASDLETNRLALVCATSMRDEDAQLVARAPTMARLLQRLAMSTSSDDPRLELVRETRALLREIGL